MQIVQALTQMRRTIRKPVHSFQLRTIPYTIQPFLLAPVLPGETLESLLLQARVVSDPVKHPLIGWWNEYYIFYVKHRDLTQRAKFTDMMVNPTWDASAAPDVTDTGTSLFHYYNGQAAQKFINWSAHCLERVVDEFFRDEGEVSADHLIDGKPAAGITQTNWMDSVTTDAEYVASPDVDVEGPDANATIQASEVERAMMMYAHLRESGLTQQTYEEYLATHGVNVPDPEVVYKPEVIRYVKNWSYPSNTVDPVTGTPSSALSWSVAERADKKRFFKEPGFIYGVTVKRPKVYLSGQKGNASAVLNDVYAWLPATLINRAHASMKKIAALKGPLSAVTVDYWVDVKDLLLYGDQFINFALTETDAGLVALPTTSLSQRRYLADLAAVQALFVTGASKYFVREDGVVNLDIAGRQRDTTPRVL